MMTFLGDAAAVMEKKNASETSSRVVLAFLNNGPGIFRMRPPWGLGFGRSVVGAAMCVKPVHSVPALGLLLGRRTRAVANRNERATHNIKIKFGQKPRNFQA